MSDLDLRDAFESSFGPEPPLRPIDSAVDAGRAALRRRNGLVGGAGLLAASIVILGATQLGGTPRTAPDIAGSPSATPTISEQQRLTDATRVDSGWRSDCGNLGQQSCEAYAEDASPVSLDTDGELVRISDDIAILQVVVDDSPPADASRTVVEAITPPSAHPGWWVLTRTSGGVRVLYADPGRSRIDFPSFATAVTTGVDVEGRPPLERARGVLD